VLEICRRGSRREPVVGTGLGADETTVWTRPAEAAIPRTSVRSTTTIVSRRSGRVEPPPRGVSSTPIDWLPDRQRGIPFFADLIAVATANHGRLPFLHVYDFARVRMVAGAARARR